MRIGIIGSGMIGGTLGKLWLDAGHDVRFGARDLDKTRSAVDARAGVAGVAEVASWAEVVFLAVPLKATRDVATAIGPAVLGKTVLDAGNAIPNRDGADAASAAATGSGQWLAHLLPGAHVVKAFNTVNFKVIAQGRSKTPPVAVPLVGDDDNAVAVAEGLVRDTGLEPVKVGKLDRSRAIDFGAPVWNSNMNAAEVRKALGLS